MEKSDLFNTKFYKKHWFELSVAVILAFAFLLRFYNFENRYALAGDQARDAIIALESARTNKIPAVGPFSSVGNFTTGQTWYLWLAVTTSLFPFSFLTPFVILAASYVFVVFILILIGNEIGGRKLALITGILAAVSPAQITQSGNLTNPTLVALFASLALLFAIKYVKTGRDVFAFLLALFISLGISTHFQAVYLLVLIPIALVLRIPNIKQVAYVFAGLAIPFISYLIFDVSNNYYNSRGIIDYILYGQYKIYIPNRWLTYALEFWPATWGKIIGGHPVYGYFLITAVAITTLLFAVQKKLTKPLFLVIVSFILIFIALRYYRGERFDGYFVFTHPFVLLLSSWVIYSVVKLNKIIGIFILIALTLFSINNVSHLFKQETGYTHLQADYWSDLFIRAYPGKTFEVYAYKNSNESFSLPLVLYLNEKGKLNDNGYKVGFGTPRIEDKIFHSELKENTMGYQLWDLNSSSSAELIKEGWHKINPSEVYKTSAEWYLD